MDFRDLTYVLAIAKYQNITKAADSLYVTQPTLTKFLQTLEAQMGQKLFKKLGHRFVLTYAGERYVARATEILNLKKELDEEMGDIIRSQIGSLKIGFPTMRSMYMLPCTLPVFAEKYPNVHIDVFEDSSDRLEELLLRGEADLAFFNLPITSPDIDYEVISHEELLLVMAKNSPYAALGVERAECRHPWMDLRLLEGAPFIMQAPSQRTRQRAELLCRAQGFKPSMRLLTTNIPAGVELAAKGYGCFFVTETHLCHMKLSDSFVCFSVGDPYTTVDFVVAFRRGCYISHHAREYIKIVRNFT